MTGGEAHVFSLYEMPSKYSMLLQNCHVSPRGGIEKIPGFVALNTETTGVQLTSGFEFRLSVGARSILCAGGGNVYQINEATGAVSVVTSGLAGEWVSFTAMNNICIMCNGADAPWYYDGVVSAPLGGSPPATAFKAHVHKGRVWMLERANKMLATCSSLNNPQQYTGGTSGYIDFKHVLKRGDELLDIATYVDLLVFYFRDHIAIYSGQTPVGEAADFQLVQLIEGVGVVNTGTVKAYATDAVFLHDAGLKSLKQVVTTGGLTIGEASQPIAATLQDAIAANSAHIYGMAHYPAKSWLMMLLKDTIWIYSYLWKAWGRMKGADVRGLFDTIQGEAFLCGNGYLYKYGDGYSFNGAKIDMRWETAYIAFDRRGGRMGYPKFMELLLKSSGGKTTMQYHLRYDYDPPDPLYSGQYTTFSALQPDYEFDLIEDFDGLKQINLLEEEMPPTLRVRLPLFGGGKAAQIVFHNDSTVGPLEINDILLLTEIGGP